MGEGDDKTLVAVVDDIVGALTDVALSAQGCSNP
jgi:hypothetical protein